MVLAWFESLPLGFKSLLMAPRICLADSRTETSPKPPVEVISKHGMYYSQHKIRYHFALDVCVGLHS